MAEEEGTKQLIVLLNSKFGLLVSGALISGVLVQCLGSKLQQDNWKLQQKFTAERARFEKELDQKYKILEDINAAVAGVLTHSQFVVVGQTKNVPREQANQLMNNYNEAVLKWDREFRLYAIRLKTLFGNQEVAKWEAIKKERDDLDVTVYRMTERKSAPDNALKLIETISDRAVELSQRMISEINDMKQRDLN